MKKISLKTFRKSFNLSKSKDETEFMVVQPQSLAGDFVKDDSLFGSGSIGSEDEKGKNRSKSESLMGTLKRRLSAKQKTKGKGGTASTDEDTFSSASAPGGLKDVRAPRPIRSTSLRSHHYSPTPWPLRPTSSEETCIKMEMRVKALVHAASPGPVNDVRKDLRELQPRDLRELQPRELRDLQPEPCPESRCSPSSPGDLSLHLEEHVPVVIGLMSQDYLQYTVPLDDGMCPLEGPRSCCLDTSSPMEVSAIPLPGRVVPSPKTTVMWTRTWL